MAIHWPTIGTLLRCELRMLLRDRRTVVISLVLPLLVMPIFFYAGRFSEEQREERIEARTFDYAVAGAEAELARALIREGAVLAAKDDPVPATPATPATSGANAAPLDLAEKEVADPAAALEAREIAFYIEAFGALEAQDLGLSEQPKAPAEGARRTEPSEPAALPAIRLVYAGDWDYSQTAMGAMLRRLELARAERRDIALRATPAAIAARDVAPVQEKVDVATAGQRTGLRLGRFALGFLLMFLLTGGSVVAADTLAGEKERGTLETLLTTAAGRIDIVAAKMAAIFVVGVVISLSQVLSFALYAGFGLIELPESFQIELPPIAVLLLLALLVPLAALVAGVLLLISGRSRSYKEFQFNFFPVSLLALLPGAAAAMPGIELRSAIVLVPVANLSVAVREVLVGTYDWPMLALAWAISAAAAVLTMRATLNALSAERLVTAAENDEADFLGGAGLFERNVLRNFAVMWVVLFMGSALIPALQESIRLQLLFNLVVVFLGGSIWMIYHYRLQPTEVLAWRPASPIAWLATVIGAPSLLLTGFAVVQFSSYLLPVPESMLESFGKALLPADLTLWQMLLGMAVLPGICEEVAFRGVLLHGLRRRFSPLMLCLVVGIIFGIFHFALFRLISAAFLGAALTAVTLLTGSIKPAIVWHALNNACALLANHYEIDLMALDPKVYAVSTVVALLCFVLLWRHRRVYPGLRQPRPASTSR